MLRRKPGERPADRRLALCVLTALLIHSLILLLPGTRARPAARPMPGLRLQLAHPAATGQGTALPPASGQRDIGQPGNLRAPRPAPPAPAETAATGAGENGVSAPNTAGDIVGDIVIPSATRLVDSAHDIARKIAREQREDRRQNVPLADRPRLPELERALRQASAGEMRSASGLVRVTNASGGSYCLQPAAEFARSGLVEPLSVPGTCP